MAMSGIPWWTTDVGGFFGGDIETDDFRELIVRWFQYGVFCPVLRLHGYRSPMTGPMPRSGAENEIWSFGEATYQILKSLLALRERLRPYLHELMQIATQRGIPPLRPLFLEFPEDPTCETIEDEFMLGAEVLVAPVLCKGVRRRKVYLPAGIDWVDVCSGKTYAGGQPIEVSAPLETIPVFLRAGGRLMDVFQPSS